MGRVDEADDAADDQHERQAAQAAVYNKVNAARMEPLIKVISGGGIVMTVTGFCSHGGALGARQAATNQHH